MVEIVASFCGAVQTVRYLRAGGAAEFTLGADERASFVVPNDWQPAPLVRRAADGGYEVVFDAALSGERVTAEGERARLDELIARGEARPVGGGAWACAVGAGDRFVLVRGALAFVVTQTSAPEPRALAPSFDWLQLVLLGSSGAAFCLCLLAYLITPHSRPRYYYYPGEIDPRLRAHFLLQAPRDDGDPGGRAPNGHALGDRRDPPRSVPDDFAIGTLGRDARRRAGLYGLRGPQDNPGPYLAREAARERAERAGVVGLIRDGDAARLPSIFGRGSAIGEDAENVLANLVGGSAGDTSGGSAGGIGLNGTGGGGTGEGTIGLGRLGTIGRGGGSGSGWGPGAGTGRYVGRRTNGPEVRLVGAPVVRGDLDREIIRRVTRRHFTEVRFCYERALIEAPNAEGRLVVRFVIVGAGRVLSSEIEESTLSLPTLERCVADAVRRWEFPKTPDGGLVTVHYPFVFNKTDR